MYPRISSDAESRPLTPIAARYVPPRRARMHASRRRGVAAIDSPGLRSGAAGPTPRVGHEPKSAGTWGPRSMRRGGGGRRAARTTGVMWLSTDTPKKASLLRPRRSVASRARGEYCPCSRRTIRCSLLRSLARSNAAFGMPRAAARAFASPRRELARGTKSQG